MPSESNLSQADTSQARERAEEQRGTGRFMLGGAIVAVVAFVACLVWLFAIVPYNGLAGRAHGPTAATGALANQASGQSIAAKNDQVMPEPSATGGGGQGSSGNAAQIERSAAPLKLSDSQRQQIDSYFAGDAGNRIQQADFGLSIGAAVPAEVVLRKLPENVSSAMGGYHGDDYVIVGKQLVIVDAAARRIVAIVPNIGSADPPSGTAIAR